MVLEKNKILHQVFSVYGMSILLFAGTSVRDGVILNCLDPVLSSEFYVNLNFTNMISFVLASIYINVPEGVIPNKSEKIYLIIGGLVSLIIIGLFYKTMIFQISLLVIANVTTAYLTSKWNRNYKFWVGQFVGLLNMSVFTILLYFMFIRDPFLLYTLLVTTILFFYLILTKLSINSELTISHYNNKKINMFIMVISSLPQGFYYLVQYILSVLAEPSISQLFNFRLSGYIYSIATVPIAVVVNNKKIPKINVNFVILELLLIIAVFLIIFNVDYNYMVYIVSFLCVILTYTFVLHIKEMRTVL